MAFIQLKDSQSAMEDCSDAIDLDSTLDYAYTYRGLAPFISRASSKVRRKVITTGDTRIRLQTPIKHWLRSPMILTLSLSGQAAIRELKNYAAAIQDYKKLIDLNPQYEAAYGGVVGLYSAITGFTQATLATIHSFSIQTYTQGISANPDSVTLYYQRGMTYNLNDDRSAANDFNKAILNYTKKAKPTELEKNYAIFAITFGASAYNRLKDDANALATINKCDELFPDNLSCLTYKGSFYLKDLKDYQKAVEVYNKAIKFNEPSAFYNLAEAYFGLNDKTNAIATINKGLSLFPNNKDMWQQAGNFYRYIANDIGKATEYYNKAVQLGSESAKQSLGFIAEEKQRTVEDKQRKKERRNAAILSIMGAVNQGLETYNSSRQKPSTPQTPQPNTSTRSQTTQSGNTK